MSNCQECGKPLIVENYTMADGCPCNSPRGINHGLVPRAVCTCLACDPEKTGSTRFRLHYRKKPVVIKAVQWDGLKATYDLLVGMGMKMARYKTAPDGQAGNGLMHGLAIFTLEGTMSVDHGDWIINGVKGEFYPCKPDIFAATYETVDARPTSRELAMDVVKTWESRD